MSNPVSTSPRAVDDRWESDLAELLALLSSTQDELLALLAEKRQRLSPPDPEGLAALAPREADLLARLQECQTRRAKLLTEAGAEGLPDQSLKRLTEALGMDSRARLQAPLAQAESRQRILQHQCLANWVVVQRTLLHLSQLLEILATGGRLQPTYGTGGGAHGSGSLLDSAA